MIMYICRIYFSILIWICFHVLPIFFFLVAGGFLETRPINSLNKVTNKRKSTTNTMFTATVTSSTPPLNNHTSLCLSGKIYFHHFFSNFYFKILAGNSNEKMYRVLNCKYKCQVFIHMGMNYNLHTYICTMQIRWIYRIWGPNNR